jgi:hypothetical protein
MAIDRLRPDSGDALEFSENLIPTFEIILSHQSGKKVKQPNPGGVGTLVVDLFVRTEVSHREGRIDFFCHESPIHKCGATVVLFDMQNCALGCAQEQGRELWKCRGIRSFALFCVFVRCAAKCSDRL